MSGVRHAAALHGGELMRIIARFSKMDNARFISHLDTQRVLQRALRRAKLPVAYSSGFNPHPLLSFVLALPVGMQSDSEYMDITMQQDISPDAFISAMNAVLPKGFYIHEAHAVENSYPSLTKRVMAASYTAVFDDPAGVEDKIRLFLEKDSVKVMKKGKGGLRELDIRPLVYHLELKNNTLYMLLASSSSDILMPALLLRTLLKDDHGAQVTRTGLYASRSSREALF
jgi:radical SAM-linked protein